MGFRPPIIPHQPWVIPVLLRKMTTWQQWGCPSWEWKWFGCCQDDRRRIQQCFCLGQQPELLFFPLVVSPIVEEIAVVLGCYHVRTLTVMTMPTQSVMHTIQVFVHNPTFSQQQPKGCNNFLVPLSLVPLSAKLYHSFCPYTPLYYDNNITKWVVPSKWHSCADSVRQKRRYSVVVVHMKNTEK